MKILFIFVAVIFSNPQAFSNCTSPAGVAGQLQWISTDSKMKYCNGTVWRDTTQSSAGSCSGVSIGTLNYSSGNLRYCDGANWFTMNNSTTMGTCSAGEVGKYAWDAGQNRMKLCNGTNWYDLTNTNCLGTPWGTVANGYSNTAYSATNPNGTCASVSQVRTCSDGAMSGSFSQTTCKNGCGEFRVDSWGSISPSADSNGNIVNGTCVISGSIYGICDNGVWRNTYNDCIDN